MEEIKPTDLMIGNAVVGSDDEIHIITKFSHDKVYYEKYTNQYGVRTWPYDQISECKPVTITEEILLKCGLKKKAFTLGIEYIHSPEYFMISANKNNKDRFNYLDIEIKYLHQLQNLFKLLTGNDLKIKVDEL